MVGMTEAVPLPWPKDTTSAMASRSIAAAMPWRTRLSLRTGSRSFSSSEYQEVVSDAKTSTFGCLRMSDAASPVSAATSMSPETRPALRVAGSGTIR